MLDFFTKSVKTVVCGGGDVSLATGDAFASRYRLFNLNGSTETGSYPLLRPSGRYPSEDWKYICPHPDAGLEVRPREKGVYEVILVRYSSFEQEQPIFKIFPHLKEYSTKDLFTPHPTKANLWTFQSRTDDTIVFKSGSMCSPIAMEQHALQHLDVEAVLMTGTGRYQPALLIELKSEASLSGLEHFATLAHHQRGERDVQDWSSRFEITYPVYGEATANTACWKGHDSASSDAEALSR